MFPFRSRSERKRRQVARSGSIEALEVRAFLSADYGGNSLALATNLGTDGNTAFYDAVDGQDRADYYAFTVSRTSTVQLAMSGMVADVDMGLLSGSGSRLAASTNGGSSNESIRMDVQPGRYVIFVYPYNSAASRYYLSLNISQSTSSPADYAGNSQAASRNLGTLRGQVTMRDYVDANDLFDYYRFDIADLSTVTVSVDGMSQNADLRLYNSNGYMTGSFQNGSTAESVTRTLERGTYYALVSTFGSNATNYSVRFQANLAISQFTSMSAVGISSSRIRVNWSDVSGEDGYRVQQWNNGWQTVANVSANQSSYVVTGLSSGTQYYYRVLAYNTTSTVESSYVAAMTSVEPPQFYSTSLTASLISDSQIVLNWTNASDEQGYQVFRFSSGQWRLIQYVSRDVTSTVVSGLFAGEQNYFRVEAYNQGGTSTTNVTSATTELFPSNDSRLANARTQLRNLNSTDASLYRQLPQIPLTNYSWERSAAEYGRVVEQFNVGDTSRSTNISNRYTRGGYGNWDTRCNIFAADVMRAMGAALPVKGGVDNMTRGANALNDWLKSDDGIQNGWVKVDTSTAAGLQRVIDHVRSGRPALASLASWVSTVGHIAVIRPDQPGSIQSSGDLVISQAGANNFSRGTLTTGFGSTYGVEVFIHI